jgi:membrane-bound lytic murein transglycosylase D
MAKNAMILLFCVLLACGCAVLKPGSERKPTSVSPPPDSLVLDPRVMGAYREQMDAALALYAFGEVSEFVAARDSLRTSIDELADTHPSIVFQPEFIQLVDGLAELDSLYPAGLGHAYLAEEDSLALSAEVWPEVDSTQSPVPSSSVYNSPFPVISNERIEFWIRYFTGPGRDRFERALYRMELHRPTIERILLEQGVHNDLICVALIESGFDLRARSYAKAVGPWQFIAGTARLYALRVDWWYDERRDIIASTYAATNYLKDLYGLWNDWFLALASYNCGEYRVARAISQQKTQDFWALDLPKQTERYVPKFLAALYIVTNPERYGFTIPDVEPIAFDQVTIKDATDLKVIAKFCGTTEDYLVELNPNLLRWCTPPEMEVAVKVPVGTAQDCARQIEAIPPEDRVTWRRHQIRSGETLSQIADRYNTTVAILKSLNRIKNPRVIRAGGTLIVPIQGAQTEVASSKPRYREKRRTIDKTTLEQYTKKFDPPAGHKRVVHTVKKHDTLGGIAEAYQTSAKRIRNWNNLSHREYIYPEQRLVIYVPESFDVPRLPTKNRPHADDEYIRQKYVVKRGDTLYSISRKLNVGITELLTWNRKSAKSVIRPGEVLEIRRKKSD